MKSIWPKIALLLLCGAALAFELWHFRNGSGSSEHRLGPFPIKNGPNIALLPASEVAVWARYFAPGSEAESWEPTLGEMNGSETALAQISALSSSNPDLTQHIDNPRTYYRQYLAVSVKGKRMLFLNALCSVEQDGSWRKHLVIVRDGGKCFRHAIYDPSVQKFSDLTINGQA